VLVKYFSELANGTSLESINQKRRRKDMAAWVDAKCTAESARRLARHEEYIRLKTEWFKENRPGQPIVPVQPAKIGFLSCMGKTREEQIQESIDFAFSRPTPNVPCNISGAGNVPTTPPRQGISLEEATNAFYEQHGETVVEKKRRITNDEREARRRAAARVQIKKIELDDDAIALMAVEEAAATPASSSAIGAAADVAMIDTDVTNDSTETNTVIQLEVSNEERRDILESPSKSQRHRHRRLPSRGR